MKTYLIVDASNILYRSFFASLNDTYTKKSHNYNGYDEDKNSDVSILPNLNEEIDIGLAVHKALVYLNKYYRQFKANEIIMVFDPELSWRKAYTKNKDAAYTKKVYKANRRKDLTPSQIERFKVFDEHVDSFHKLLQEKTGVITLRKKYIECDDFIARITQLYPDDKHIIISADKDFMQLLGNKNVTLIDPATDKPRDLSEWDNDAQYFIFEKCIRGDIGDNVQSSYPRLRKNKIIEAYNNDLSRTNIMQHQFEVEWLDNGVLQKHTYETGRLFEENRFLMDLTQQPEPIIKIMDAEIELALNNRGKFDYMGFLRYCGSLQLQSIVKDIANFVPLLSGKGTLTTS